MNRFRSRPRTPEVDDDPTQILQSWRDQQRRERLADTREFPELLGEPQPASSRRPAARQRPLPLVLAAAVGALAVLGVVAVASAVQRPTDRDASATSTSAPTTVAPSTTASSADSPTPTSASSGDTASGTTGDGGGGASGPADNDPGGGPPSGPAGHRGPPAGDRPVAPTVPPVGAVDASGPAG